GPPQQPGELEESAEALAGVARARRAGDRRVEATCLSGYAKGLFRRRMVDSAVVVNGRAISLQHATADKAGLAASLQWQGYALVAAREYGAARLTLLAALDASRASGNWLPAGVSLISLASLSVRFGELGGARRYAATGDSLLLAQGNDRGRAGLLAVRGDIARASGDTAEARRLYLESLELAQRFGGYGTVAPRRGLASLARATGDWPGAAAHLEAARASATQYGMRDWARRLDYDAGTLALAQSDLSGAERQFSAFMAGLPPDDRALALPARLQLAAIAARNGLVVRAESLAVAAFDDLDAWRLQVDDRTLGLQAFALRELDLAPGVGLPVVAQAMVRSGHPGAALALVERARAWELRDAQLRLRSWGGMVGADKPEVRGSGPMPPDSSTAVIEFVIGGVGEPTLAFLLTHQGIRVFPGPPAEGLAEAVTRFRALVESGSNPARLDPALTEAMVGPVLGAVPSGVTTVVIVPDGALHRTPFDALRLRDGRLVVTRYAIVIAPSIATMQARGSGQPTGPPNVLAIANPSQQAGAGERSVEADLFRRAFEDMGGLPPLPASEGEARRAAQISPGATIRLRGQASESWFKQADLQQFDVIHIAAHAVVSDDDLGGSAVALAPGNGNDGFVTAADLSRLRLNAAVVVLSGCRTTEGVLVAGEGIQGLTAPLLRAGAESVLATAWRVRDADAARFIELFYRELERDGAVALALGRAKRAAVAAGVPASTWAWWVLVGNPRARVGLGAPLRAGY
ncbi:MAG: CHAT domain-containing protein, partial [Gemmatimonadales bacterium]